MSVKHYSQETSKWEIFPGTVGAPGKDAYTIAQENGYTGNQAEYTDALVKIPTCVDKIVNADQVPTKDSGNLAISGGIYTAIENARSDAESQLEITKGNLENSIASVDKKVDDEVTNRIQYVQDSIYDGLDYNNAEVKKSLSAIQGRILNEKMDSLVNSRFKIVDTLPDVGEPNIIYLVPKTSPVTDTYDEYIYINTGSAESPTYTWEKIGQTDINLEPYELKTDHASDVSQLNSAIGTNTTNISSNLTRIKNIENNGARTIKSLTIRKTNTNGSFTNLLTTWNGGKIVDGVQESDAIVTIPADPTQLPNPTSISIIANKTTTTYNGSVAATLNLDNIYTKSLKTVDTPGSPGIYINTTASSLTIANNVTDDDPSAIVITKGDCVVTLPSGTYTIDEIDQMIGTAYQQKVYCIEKIATKVYINCAIYNYIDPSGTIN